MTDDQEAPADRKRNGAAKSGGNAGEASADMLYGIEDRPVWYLSMLLGLQVSS